MTCPRCGGHLYEDDDYAGRFLSCLTCGELIPLDTINYIGPSYDPEGKRDNTRYTSGRPRKGPLRGQTPAQHHPRA